MAENSGISWTDHTWSPWYGCTQVSMGPQGACEGCYARHMSETRFGRVVFGGPGRGEGTRDVRADSAWKEPLRWNREAAAAIEAWRANPFARPETPKPSTFIFPSMCDPFDNHPALTEPRRRFFDLIRATPNLTWLLLTKRPGLIVREFNRIVAMTSGPADLSGWPRNAAIGFTAVTQDELDRDWPKARAAFEALNPAFLFVSDEPALGGMVLPPDFLALGPRAWVITGGETDQGKHKARPADPAWFRSLRDQCAAAGVPFHFKQWGEWQPVGSGPWRTGDHSFLEDDSAEPDARLVRTVRRYGSANDPHTLDGVAHLARPEVTHGR